MAAEPTTVSPHSVRSEHSRHVLRRRQVLPSLVRVLAGVVLLAVGLVAWVAGQWVLSERGQEPGAVIAEQGSVVKATGGEQMVLWVPEEAAGQVPTCRVTDLVYAQQLKVSAPTSTQVQTLDGRTYVGAGVFTPGSSQVRVACAGTDAPVAAAPAPEGAPALRDGRWSVLVAMALGVTGVLLLGRELLGTELTSPVRRRKAEISGSR